MGVTELAVEKKGEREEVVVVERSKQVREEDERRPPLVVVLLGVAAVLGFFLGWVFAPSVAASPPGGGGVLPVVGVGVNGNQIFSVEVPPGSFVYVPFRMCNFAGSPVYVEAWVEAPEVFRVFAVYIGNVWFGARFGNYSRWSAFFKRRECVDAKLEVLVDARAQRGVRYIAAVHYKSTLS